MKYTKRGLPEGQFRNNVVGVWWFFLLASEKVKIQSLFINALTVFVFFESRISVRRYRLFRLARTKLQKSNVSISIESTKCEFMFFGYKCSFIFSLWVFTYKFYCLYCSKYGASQNKPRRDNTCLKIGGNVHRASTTDNFFCDFNISRPEFNIPSTP